MDTVDSYLIKRRRYMPVFPRAKGKPTISIEGYPCEDGEPMAATGFHAEQIVTSYNQLQMFYSINEHIHIGADTFIYYREGDITKAVSPDIYVVLGVDKNPLRRSFYTWAEGAAPTVAFEFLTDAMANQNRREKARLHIMEVGIQEYFIHQPDMERPQEFRGWRQTAPGGMEEIAPDERGGLFSEALNLWFRWENRLGTRTRLLRPYLPDGNPILTSTEVEVKKEEAEALAGEEAARRREEAARRREAEALAREETARRQEVEALVREEAAKRQEAEAEIERLRAQLTDRRAGSA